MGRRDDACELSDPASTMLLVNTGQVEKVMLTRKEAIMFVIVDKFCYVTNSEIVKQAAVSFMFHFVKCL